MTRKCLWSRTLFCACAGGILVCCACGTFIEEFYNPAIIFEGYYKDEWIELPGHLGSPNTCEMRGDTIMLFCYSSDFEPAANGLSHGYMLQMWIHPFTIDTTNDFCTEHIKARFSERAVGMDQLTHVLYVQDTIWGPPFTGASGTVEMLGRSRGDSIHITEIYLPLHNESQSALAATIRDGVLYGAVER